MASREELMRATESQEMKIDERHREHMRVNAELKEELSELRSMVARIEGQLSGRYPNLVGKRGP